MRNERGITLLVLVISIMIMLILAGVVITYILGDTGIFNNASKAKIMSRVEALDDTIKAYTLKSTDPYSSSQKTVQDLIDEGILKQITLTGNNAESTKDNKTIYYVNFENEDVEVAKLLGLDEKVYENLEKLNTFTYRDIKELQDKGIYVVDNDLNAAYLKNDTTYGKLVNFGVVEDDIYVGEFTQQTLTLQINQRVQEPKQEVVFILDRSPSMVAPQDVNANPVRVYGYDGKIYRKLDPNGIDWEMTWNKTRWAGILKAADTFCDTYFDGASGNRALTIYTYYGPDYDGKNRIEKLTVDGKASFIDAATAKKSYANICSKQQFMYACKYLIQQYYQNYQKTKDHNATMIQVHELYAKQLNPNVNSSWGAYKWQSGKRIGTGDFAVYFKPFTSYEINNKDAGDGYRIDCGVFQGDKNNSMMLDSFWQQKYSYTNPDGTVEHYNGCEKATLGPGTPTPDALIEVRDNYLYQTEIPKDIIILTDGDYSSSYNIGTEAGKIKNNPTKNTIGGKEIGIYPIAYGAAVKNFKGQFDGNYTKFYVAGDEKALAENFAEILANVIKKTEVQTNTSESHSLQYVGEDGQIQEFKQEGIYQIILELKGKDKTPITVTFDKSGNNSGGVKSLDSIYQDGVIKLENTWQQLFGSNPDELNAYNDKKITVYIE